VYLLGLDHYQPVCLAATPFGIAGGAGRPTSIDDGENSRSRLAGAIIAASAPKPRRDETLIKALVRAHRWRRRIESGQARSITDLAEQEDVTVAYVCRLLPLTRLAPDIFEAILDGRQPKGLRLAEILGNGPPAWEEQRSVWR
jgi:hypothetical protein